MSELSASSRGAQGLILVTGAAGFIGSHVARRLRDEGNTVIGCDSFNHYYDPRLKSARVETLLSPVGVECLRLDLADANDADVVFATFRPACVVHLAAQAGVRHSITQPEDYVASNLVAFANVLRGAQRVGTTHLLFASSSSVYGARTDAPFREIDPTNAPMSFYAATKVANEAMAYAYTQTHGLRCTGLRFFTAYGPWGRPDMAYFSFAQRLARGQPLPVFADGELLRDFTYIDDVVESVVRLTLAQPLLNQSPFEIFNVGNQRPVRVIDFIATLASLMEVEPKLEFLPMQPGDVPITCADASKLRERTGFEPATSLRDGLARFVAWFRSWQEAERELGDRLHEKPG